MRNSACWVSFTASEAGVNKLLTSNHWMLEGGVHSRNAHLLEDVGLSGGFFKVAELFAKVGFKCVSVRKEGEKLAMLYAWNPESSNSSFFPVKEGYSVLSMLVKTTRGKASGALLDGSSLHWFYPEANRDGVVFRQVYLENVKNGFTDFEDFSGLEQVSNILNVKEQMLLVLQEPSIGGMFPKIEQILNNKTG